VSLSRQSEQGPTWRIDVGDCRELLAAMPEESVATCITSPPYFGLRDYGRDGQIGLELSPEEFVAVLVDVFRGVRRVLRDDGTLWLNLGDSFCSTDKWGGGKGGNTGKHTTHGDDVPSWAVRARKPPMPGVKPKDLIGIPWMVAFALRADGWYLRSDIIWSKPNPMPESVTDRPTKAHEYLFLLSKCARYFYDADAIKEEATGREPGNKSTHKHTDAYLNDDEFSRTKGGLMNVGAVEERNKRTVWTVPSAPFAGAHFATFPPKLIEPCILAGSREGDTVLDPFSGAGTTGMVALRHGRSYVGIELNPAYASLARERIIDDAPLLNIVGMVA
jgi:DNA modification methylase